MTTQIDTGIYKFMDCSTGHLTKESNEYLMECSGRQYEDVLVYAHRHGFFLYVCGDEALVEEDLKNENIPQCVRDIIKKAHQHDCFWVKLDADGTCFDDLPYYEWQTTQYE